MKKVVVTLLALLTSTMTGTPASAQHGPIGAALPAETLAPQQAAQPFSANLLPPEPTLLGPQAVDAFGAPQQSWLSSRRCVLSAFAGMSYLDGPPGAPAAPHNVGGLHGIQGAAPILGGLGAVGAVAGNHYDGGDQLFATLGLAKAPTFSRSHGVWRTAYNVMFDYYKTNAGSTELPSFWQLRLEGFYWLSRNAALGVRYTEPLTSDANVAVGAGPIIQTRFSRSVVALFQKEAAGILWNAQAGWIEEGNELLVGLGGRVPLNERVGLFANAAYDTGHVWTGAVGLEFKLGRGRRPCIAGSGNDVIRGQAPAREFLYPDSDDPFEAASDGSSKSSFILYALAIGDEETAAYLLSPWDGFTGSGYFLDIVRNFRTTSATGYTPP